MNHYEALGVPRAATSAEIKRAYRRMSKKHHPDRGGDPKVMALVNIAHDTLMDPARREHYDRTGEEKPVNSIDIEARNGLLTLFMSYLQQEVRFNIPARAKRDLLEARAKIEGSHRDLLKQIAKLAARREEVTSEGEENLWTQLIDQATGQLQDKVTECTHKLAITARALEMIQAYRSGVIDAAPQASFGPLSEMLRAQMGVGRF